MLAFTLSHLAVRIITLILLLGCALALLPARAIASGLSWSEPIQLSESLSDEIAIATSPELVVDHAGTLHLVWYSVVNRADERSPGFSDLLIYRARVGGAWTASYPIVTQERPFVGDAFSTTTGGAGARNPAFELRASLLAGNDNQLHLVMGNLKTQWFLNAPLAEVVRAMAILPPWPLSQGPSSQIASSRDGSLYTLLSAIPPGVETIDAPDVCLSCTDIFIRRSEDGGVTWSRPENLSRQEQHDQEPQVVVDTLDRLHIIWQHQASTANDPSTGRILYRRSEDQGLSWREPVSLGPPGEGVAQGVIAATHTNNVLVVYEGATSGSVFYQHSFDGGLNWSEPGLIPSALSRSATLRSYRRLSLAADGNGHIHLLMVGLPPATDSPSAQLLHLIWDGQRWSEPAIIASGAANPLGPRLVVERGNRLHAVWFTSIPDPLSGDEQQAVWYSEAALAAPVIAPPATLTPLPTVAPPTTPTTVILPTATPLPLALREQAPIDGPPLWELRGLQGIAIGLLATTLLIALIAMVRLRRSR